MRRNKSAATGRRSPPVVWSITCGIFARHAKCVQLVAVKVAKITDVERIAAKTRRALVSAAQFQRLRVQRVDLFGRINHQRHHSAIADTGFLTVSRFDDGYGWRARTRGPGNKIVCLHETCRSEFCQQRVVECRRLIEFVGTQRYVTDHVCFPFWFSPPQW